MQDVVQYDIFDSTIVDNNVQLQTTSATVETQQQQQKDANETKSIASK